MTFLSRFRLSRATVFLLISVLSLLPAASEEPPVRRTDNPWVVLRAFLVSYPERIQGVDRNNFV